MPDHVRRRRLRLIWAVVLLLAITVGAVGWWLGSGRWTHVPSLVGQKEGTAIGLLQESGLDPSCCTRVFSETVPAGVVVQAKPGRGDAIRGTQVRLTVSRGAERYVVDPALVGQDQAAVLQQLAGLPLQFKPQERYDPSLPAGKVIGFDPPAGKQLPRNTTVAVLVSKGHAPVTVPNLTGQTPDAATQNLKELGFTVVRGDDGRSATVQAGQVMGSTPPAGQSAAYGSQVSIQVSAGMPQVKVPDVTGKNIEQATKILQDAGLKVQVQKFFGNKVLRQAPAAGQTVDQGSTVTILVSFG